VDWGGHVLHGYYLALTTTTSRIVISPPRLWFGVQTAYTDSDWLKQLKHFTAGHFVLAETKQFQNSFETFLSQFRFIFFQLYRQFNNSDKFFCI